VSPKRLEPNEILQEGQRVLAVEADALRAASLALSSAFPQAVQKIFDCQKKGGKIVVSGVGKSGNVAQKVAATLTSTGSTAVFLHPTEALHGDLGLLSANDVLLIFSNGGSSQELLLMLPSARELCASVVAVLGNTKGSLAAHADHVIGAGVSAEACPHNLAPTASSTVAMAIGDAIALALKALAGFGPEKYAKLHPGGQLGKRLLTLVEDLMHPTGEFGVLGADATMDEVVIALTKYRHSGICITAGQAPSGNPLLLGVVVEGDIRRALLKKEAFFQLRAKDIMTIKPKSVGPKTKATDALDLMERGEGQISFLPVVDESGGCVGVIRVHDLVLSGLS
jgi:arabinose-5-phosphate isomerase